MTTANLIALIVAIVGPFVFVLGLDLILTLASRRDFSDFPYDENGRPERD